MPRLPRYQRVADYPHFEIGRPKHLILEAVGRFHYLSAPQLTRLLFSPSSLTYTQRHLKDLYQSEYLNRVFLPTATPQGSSLAIYCLDKRGISFLRGTDKDTPRRFRPSEEAQREWLFLRHTLAANEVLILAERLAKLRPDIVIAQLRTERELKQAPTTVKTKRGERSVIPDGWVDIRRQRPNGRQLQTCLAIELDRGTVPRLAFQRKIQALVHYADGPYQADFGTESLTIAFVVVADETRLKQVLTWTEEALDQLKARNQADLFGFWVGDPSTTDPEEFFSSSSWHTPFTSSPEPLLD